MTPRDARSAGSERTSVPAAPEATTAPGVSAVDAERVDAYLLLVLHAHLPFVRHPEHERFLEESWLFEAISECYLPLLLAFDELREEGVDFRLTLTFSATLLAMLADPLLGERYREWLDRRIELAGRETFRLRDEPELRDLARFYLERFRVLREYWDGVLGRDVVGAFRRLQDEGRVELGACAATHGYLPLLRPVPSSVRAQVRVGVEEHRRHFGRDPAGIWLPECGFYPGLDEVLAEHGLRWFCLESHGVLHGDTRPRYGVHAPLVCPSGTAAFGRDPECSRQVWSAESGYPADADYRDFHTDIGYEEPIEYIGPYVGPDGDRTATGIKYRRVTGPGPAKAPYVRAKALEKASLHAADFVRRRSEQAARIAPGFDRRAAILAPYDAELFGHWWFEGPEWVAAVLRQLVPGRGPVVTATPSEYLAEYPEGQLSMPSASSWGEHGYNEVWLSPENEWLWPRLHAASRRLERLGRERSGAAGLERRALVQAGREVLLAQASDWPFILRTGTTTGYARRRIVEHLEAAELLLEGVEERRTREAMVTDLERRHDVFPGLDPAVFTGPEEGEAEPAGTPRHVAFLVAEMAPLVKVGGLADVAGALPAALGAQGVRTTVVLPAYGTIDRERFGIRPVHDGLEAPLGPHRVGFRLLEADRVPAGVRLLLIEHHDYFGRDGVYVDPHRQEEYPDNAIRFTFFTRAALEALRVLGEPVDVVHCHDHQTALAPAFVRIHHRHDPVVGGAATVYTLHNLGYQGIHPPWILDLAGIGQDQCYPGSWFEYWGRVNFMKAGICFADKVSTVSETYAREICRDEVQSAGLASVLLAREADLHGIVNGIDTREWDPAADPHLRAHFDAERLDGKRECKRALLEEVGLDAAELDVPVVAMVSRLVDQKGLDLVTEAFERMLAFDLRFVLLGTGLPKYERFFEEAARARPDRVAACLRFDNGLAHRFEAGADLFLMPSLYEPCGLNQLYSLRYGTVPVVRATGGLADTVRDADEHPGGTGFSFGPYTAEALLDALRRALEASADGERWRGIVRRGMRQDLSWNRSARRYVDLYREASAARAS